MKLVIVDRDGTLNYEREGYIQTPEQWEPIPGALDAIARLNHAGFHVVIVANLPGLGRGLYDVDALNAVHARMHRELAQAGGGEVGVDGGEGRRRRAVAPGRRHHPD